MIVDCSIQITPPSTRALFPYLPEWWQDYVEESGFTAPDVQLLPRDAAWPDARPPGGGPPGSDLALVRAQLLEPWGVQIGILTCFYPVHNVHNEDFAAALAGALNDWQLAEWLAREPRLRASLVVPGQNPALAAAEIDRLGRQPGVVQVVLPVRSEAPYGKRRYWPIYEAAARHGLPVALYTGGGAGNPTTAVGWPSYAFEDHAAMPQAFQTQVLSLVAEGVFCQYPGLRVVLVGGGFTWLPALMWRFDKNWKGLRREVPWLVRPPSHYIREHVRLTVSPLDAPPEPRYYLQAVEHLGSDEMLLFAGSYPHGPAGAPGDALPAALPAALIRKIAAENARALYRFSPRGEVAKGGVVP